MKRITLLVLLLLGLYCVLFSQTQPEMPAGSGTEEDPYLIGNLANLRWLSECSEDWWIDADTQVHFLQTGDIDAAETVSWNEGSGFRPIGYYMVIYGSDSYLFTGVYDGANYDIYELFIAMENGFRYVGLFSQISNSSLINLNLIDIDILVNDTNSISYVGGLSGRTSSSIIQNCSTSGSIIHNSRTDHYTGGIIGSQYQSTIENSFSSLFITGNSNTWGSIAGGLVGVTSFSSILYSYFTGSVDINGNYNSIAGGIAGSVEQYVNIESCYSVANIYASTNLSGLYNNTYSGGITGCLDYDSFIYNCYSIGNISSIGGYYSFVGGISGSAGEGNSPTIFSRTVIDKCYSSGELIGDVQGGIVGFLQTSYIIDSFWNSQVSWCFAAYGDRIWGTVLNSFGKTSQEMKQVETYQNNGWDFYHIWNIDTNVNSGYPNLNMIASPFIRPSINNIILEDNAIKISWTIPLDPQPSTFTIYKNGSLLEESITDLFFYDLNFQNCTPYEYLVYAFYSDYEGVSISSNFREFTPFFPPQNLTYRFEDIDVVLEWEPPSELPFTVSYNITRNGYTITPYYGVTALTFTDTTTQPNTNYTYGVRTMYAIYEVGHALSNAIEVNLTTPETTNENDLTDPCVKTELIGNYPNPFNPSTIIHFSLSAKVNLRIDIYNIKGQKIKTLVDDIYPAGSHSIVWNGTDDGGYSVSSGVYLYKMTADDYVGAGKMVLMK